uniref:Uncharacterized protein n=1 Tax=Salmonella enteritidis TaxID=149539 RepID=A0A1S6KR39_SALEN|nr:hypothetical protein [Salmonella enterica subsp. enterica serovar Enteritidis]
MTIEVRRIIVSFMVRLSHHRPAVPGRTGVPHETFPSDDF